MSTNGPLLPPEQNDEGSPDPDGVDGNSTPNGGR